MSEKCPNCSRVFEDACDRGVGSIVTLAFVGGKYTEMCPLCYAEDHKIRHSASWNPKGEIASAMFEEAKHQYPDWRPK